MSIKVVDIFFLTLKEPGAALHWIKDHFCKNQTQGYDAAWRNSAGSTKNQISIEITHKSWFFFVFFVHIHYVLSYFILFISSKNVCKHFLTHITAKTCNFCLEKQRKNDDFGDFKRFSRFLTCLIYDVTVTSYKQ